MRIFDNTLNIPFLTIPIGCIARGRYTLPNGGLWDKFRIICTLHAFKLL